jgi:hypothetical protein
MKYNNLMHRRSWTQRMVNGDTEKVGVTNYYLPVYARSGCGKGHVVLLLWFFDTRGGVAFRNTERDVPEKLENFVAPEVGHS